MLQEKLQSHRHPVRHSSVSSSGTAIHPAGTAPPRAGNPLLLILAHSSLFAALSDQLMGLESSNHSKMLMEFAIIKKM